MLSQNGDIRYSVIFLLMVSKYEQNWLARVSFGATLSASIEETILFCSQTTYDSRDAKPPSPKPFAILHTTCNSKSHLECPPFVLTSTRPDKLRCSRCLLASARLTGSHALGRLGFSPSGLQELLRLWLLKLATVRHVYSCGACIQQIQ